MHFRYSELYFGYFSCKEVTSSCFPHGGGVVVEFYFLDLLCRSLLTYLASIKVADAPVSKSAFMMNTLAVPLVLILNLIKIIGLMSSLPFLIKNLGLPTRSPLRVKLSSKFN